MRIWSQDAKRCSRKISFLVNSDYPVSLVRFQWMDFESAEGKLSALGWSFVYVLLFRILYNLHSTFGSITS